MKARKNGILYNFCAFVGWLLIAGSTAFLGFLVFAGGASETALITYVYTIGAIIVGILIAMIAERNIFKALGTAASHFFGSWGP